MNFCVSYLFVGGVLVCAAVERQTDRFEVVHGLRVWTCHNLATGVFRIRTKFAILARHFRKVFAAWLRWKMCYAFAFAFRKVVLPSNVTRFGDFLANFHYCKWQKWNKTDGQLVTLPLLDNYREGVVIVLFDYLTLWLRKEIWFGVFFINATWWGLTKVSL